MRQLFFVFIGGGFGSVLRYIISRYLNNPASSFPLGTFTVNILGSLLIGIIIGFAVKNNRELSTIGRTSGLPVQAQLTKMKTEITKKINLKIGFTKKNFIQINKRCLI